MHLHDNNTEPERKHLNLSDKRKAARLAFELLIFITEAAADKDIDLTEDNLTKDDEQLLMFMDRLNEIATEWDPPHSLRDIFELECKEYEFEAFVRSYTQALDTFLWMAFDELPPDYKFYWSAQQLDTNQLLLHSDEYDYDLLLTVEQTDEAFVWHVVIEPDDRTPVQCGINARGIYRLDDNEPIIGDKYYEED